jgi:cytidine deaminase
MNHTDLIAMAIEARERAYAPYSRFKVGAALLTTSGRVYTGCNIENVAYGPTVCAERTAIFKAVSEGDRQFEVIAVATRTGITPCGVCRQVMREFAPDITILIATLGGNFRVTTLRDLLPDAFAPSRPPK